MNALTAAKSILAEAGGTNVRLKKIGTHWSLNAVDPAGIERGGAHLNLIDGARVLASKFSRQEAAALSPVAAAAAKEVFNDPQDSLQQGALDAGGDRRRTDPGADLSSAGVEDGGAGDGLGSGGVRGLEAIAGESRSEQADAESQSPLVEYVINDETEAPELSPIANDVSEPPAQDIPEMEIGDAPESASTDVPEMDIADAEPDDHGGMLRDDLINTRSMEIDNIERWRCVAAQNIVDNTDIERLQSILASGAPLSDEQAGQEREYYRSRNFIRSTRDMATDLKVSLKSMTLEKLEGLEPVKEDWPN